MYTNSRSIRFHINSKTICGCFVLTFNSFVTSKIESEIENYIYTQRQEKKNDIVIQKVNNAYEIDVNSFVVVCKIVYNVLKKCL